MYTSCFLYSQRPWQTITKKYWGKICVILVFLHKTFSRTRFKNSRTYHNFAYHFGNNYALLRDYGHVNHYATYPTTTQLGFVCRLHFLALWVLEIGLVSCLLYMQMFTVYTVNIHAYIYAFHLSFRLNKLHVFNQPILAPLGSLFAHGA